MYKGISGAKVLESCRFTHILGRKYKRFVRKICGNEEKVVILCGEWGFSSLRLAQKSYKSYFPRIHLVFFQALRDKLPPFFPPFRAQSLNLRECGEKI